MRMGIIQIQIIDWLLLLQLVGLDIIFYQICQCFVSFRKCNERLIQFINISSVEIAEIICDAYESYDLSNV